MACSFSLDHYREILRAAKARYAMPQVHEVARQVPAGDFFLIRHDVDISPWAAREMAGVEHELGVHTTYYIRFHAPYYNPLEEDTSRAIREIAAMGHEVGIHYEMDYIERRGLDPKRTIDLEIAMLEGLTGQKVRTMAQHQPARSTSIEGLYPGIPEAYQKALTLDIRYFADSAFHWREGCICTKIGRYPQIHTLMHPHEWIFPGIAWKENLARQVQAARDRMQAHMDAYLEDTVQYLKNRRSIDAAWVERKRKGP